MVEDVDKLLGLIELENEIIKKGRQKIAKLKEEKITKRAESWANATGTAKEKEDFVRAEVADIDKAIALEEANIEYCYNTIELANTKLVYCDE